MEVEFFGGPRDGQKTVVKVLPPAATIPELLSTGQSIFPMEVAGLYRYNAVKARYEWEAKKQ